MIDIPRGTIVASGPCPSVIWIEHVSPFFDPVSGTDKRTLTGFLMARFGCVLDERSETRGQRPRYAQCPVFGPQVSPDQRPAAVSQGPRRLAWSFAIDAMGTPKFNNGAGLTQDGYLREVIE